LDGHNWVGHDLPRDRAEEIACWRSHGGLV
jgi:hypothetical protein